MHRDSLTFMAELDVGASHAADAGVSQMHALAWFGVALSRYALRARARDVRWFGSRPRASTSLRKEDVVKNLDRLKKQNVRSSEPKQSLSTLSLEGLRQVVGGTSYRHTSDSSICITDI